MNLVHYFDKPFDRKNLFILCIAALIIRVFTFGLFIQHNEYYQQADSTDYHNCGYCVSHGLGMSMPSGQPIFWRTPGYPLYLSLFYGLNGGGRAEFHENSTAHKLSILFQLLLSCLIPLLLLWLAFNVTQSYIIAWLAGWIGVVHLGFVLSSCYILSDALALIFFMFFLIYFYKSFLLYKEPGMLSKDALLNAVLAAIFLASYTWIRPNGQFVVVVGLILLLFGVAQLKDKLKKIVCFGGIFFALISPWVHRNYTLTGVPFYCSMSGPIMQAFTLPKIMRTVTGKSLNECWRDCMKQMQEGLIAAAIENKTKTPHLSISRELVCKKIAWPQIKQHPFLFVYEWIKESCKATFDLYSSQLVAMVKDEHRADPLEEYLSVKWYEAIYGQPMSWSLRLLILLEVLWALFKWIGLFGGVIVFLVMPLLKRFKIDDYVYRMFFVWLKCGFMAGSLLAMTGGFGYARLRLPVDLLLIIMTLTFWYWVWMIYSKKKVHRPQIKKA